MSRAETQFDEQAALRAIVEGTVTETGEKFFRALVQNLAEALGTFAAWVTEYRPESRTLHGLAFLMGQKWIEGYQTLIDGTPCEAVVDEKRLVHYPDRILELFPRDPDFKTLQGHEPVSYMGVPLMDAAQNVLGHLAVMDIKPLPAEPRGLAIFRIFAARASAELQRLNAEKELRQREEKLASLIDSAMDAIIDVDSKGQIAVANSAAERIFRCPRETLIGKPISHLTSGDGEKVLLELMDRLKGSGEGAMHVPGALQVRRCDGETFAAEATLSRYELRGEPFYTVILRDVGERLEAEQRIKSLTAETEFLREEIGRAGSFDQIIGQSRAMRQVLKDIEQVAATDATVLIEGETGTGKELIARAIHSSSARRDKPLVRVNCAAIPASLMESEFFGHEKGAFTGATQKREGRFALADGGTLFLDEIGELPLDLQAKLLRAIQEGEFEPVGSSKTRRVEVRFIAATNRDLQHAAKEGRFREDLYYRLHVFPIRVPPLRERPDDIDALARAFVEHFSRRMGRRAPVIMSQHIERLCGYSWPGNVRELENVIERALITAPPGQINLDRALPESAARSTGSSAAPATSVLTIHEFEQLERDNITRALTQTNWSIAGDSGAAAMLGINPSTLRSRMKVLGIKRRET